MIRKVASGAVFFMLISGSAYADPITIGGILFNGGASSFADVVIGYSPGAGVGTNGSQVFNDPNAALGLPDYNGSTGAVSLGNANLPVPNFAELIVQFTDNSLTTSGDSSADLYIFEVGADVESFLVAISQDGVNWIELGALSGQPTSINIDGIAGVIPGAGYSFVRLRDDPLSTSPFFLTFAEADIDAIGAISSGAPVPTPNPVPEPATIMLMGTGLAALAATRRRRLQQQ